jgi:hypothetical protein
VIGYSFITGSVWRLKVKVLAYPMLPNCRKRLLFWKFPKLRPFVILLRVTGRSRRVWSICGMVLTGENWSTRSKKSYIAWPEPGRLWWEAGDVPLINGVALKTKMIREPYVSIISISGWMFWAKQSLAIVGFVWKLSYGEVLGDKSAMYNRVTLYWGYLIIFWLFHSGISCTVTVLACFVLWGCVYVWVL